MVIQNVLYNYNAIYNTIHDCDWLQVRFMSLEKEVFPFMAQDGNLFAFDLEGEEEEEEEEEGGGGGGGGEEEEEEGGRRREVEGGGGR